MKKRVICAILAAMMVAGAMSGCSLIPMFMSNSGSEQQESSKAESSSKVESSSKTESSSKAESSSAKVDVSSSEWKPSLTASKVGSVNNSDIYSIDFSSAGGAYKTKSKKYGVLSLDGKHDTGAKYYYAKSAKKESEDSQMTKGYFNVYSEEPGEDNPNVCGLVDSEGTEVLPCKYGYISILNSRYARVITVSEKTEDKDKALYYITDKFVSLSPDEGDTMYEGKWEIYDMQKKEFVSGVSGTRPYSIDAKGSFIEYHNDKGDSVTADATGAAVTDGRTIFSDGSYVLEKNGASTVYDTDGNKLFDFSTKDYSISSFDYYYYTARSGDYPDIKYSLIDKTGKKVSADFDSSIYQVFPDFIALEDKVCSLDGKTVMTGKYLRSDKVLKDAYYSYDDDKYTVFDVKGNVLYEGANKDDDLTNNDFLISKKSGNDRVYYNYASGAFDITASYLGDWLVTKTEGQVTNLIDVRSGKVIAENYSRYSLQNGDDGVRYIIAYNSVNGSTSNGNYDVFAIS